MVVLGAALLYGQTPDMNTRSARVPSAGRTLSAQKDFRSAVSVMAAPEGIATFVLTPGSAVDIHVFEESDLDGRFRLDDSGNISMPLAGSIHLASLKVNEAAAAIRAKLIAEEVLKDPHVQVTLGEYSLQSISVLGEVATPGMFPVLGPQSLIDVLAMAGGETVSAASEIDIDRARRLDGKTEVIHYRRDASSLHSLDVMVNPGDTVRVKRAGIVYVLGAVNRPGGFLMEQSGKLDALQALSLAFGTAREAATGNIRIIRKNADGTLANIPVPFNKLNKAETSSIYLQSEDIVYVPTNTLKSIFINGTSIIGAAAAASIYTLR
jgi:polysaccharide export outer membrane protein